ncbi:MAG: hypothetical protein A3G24_17930 [Betaproteobacteria bacterium RIFCSPLOWO2_12_FULL_62_13]|nr:MAG: hypothetical protein A3G24_17930 [Betaproteobacteria bacterium RIFCSPLOWO2_12_FULL_62_13]
MVVRKRTLRMLFPLPARRREGAYAQRFSRIQNMNFLEQADAPPVFAAKPLRRLIATIWN